MMKKKKLISGIFDYEASEAASMFMMLNHKEEEEL